MQDLLLSRYGAGIQYVLELDFEQGVALIETAVRQKQEEFLINRWLIGFQNMSFADFKNAVSATQQVQAMPTNQTGEEILDKVKKILDGVREVEPDGDI